MQTKALEANNSAFKSAVMGRPGWTQTGPAAVGRGQWDGPSRTVGTGPMRRSQWDGPAGLRPGRQWWDGPSRTVGWSHWPSATVPVGQWDGPSRTVGVGLALLCSHTHKCPVPIVWGSCGCSSHRGPISAARRPVERQSGIPGIRRRPSGPAASGTSHLGSGPVLSGGAARLRSGMSLSCVQGTSHSTRGLVMTTGSTCDTNAIWN